MTNNIQRIKLGVFSKRYWQDEESRPCRETLISHIKRGWLSGKKIGTHCASVYRSHGCSGYAKS